jgi:hypothetical protein
MWSHIEAFLDEPTCTQQKPSRIHFRPGAWRFADGCSASCPRRSFARRRPAKERPGNYPFGKMMVSHRIDGFWDKATNELGVSLTHPHMSKCVDTLRKRHCRTFTSNFPTLHRWNSKQDAKKREGFKGDVPHLEIRIDTAFFGGIPA